MEKPFEVEEGPNKPCVTYIVQCMQKDIDHEFYFEWLVEELTLEGKLALFIARLSSNAVFYTE